MAYFSKFENLGFRKGDLLIVDASDRSIQAGSTTASAVEAAYRAGVIVYSRAGLHAKAFILDDEVVVGSANLTVNSASLHEVVLVTRNSGIFDAINKWLARLINQSTLIDIAFVNRIKALPVRPAELQGRKSTLLEAIKFDSPLLPDLAFRVWSEESDVNDREIESANRVKRRPLVLPKNWTFFEDPWTRTYEKTTEALGKRSFIISFQGNGIEPHGLTSIKVLDSNALSYIGAVRLADSLISIFDPGKPAPFRLTGPEAKLLCKLLNLGLKARPELHRQINQTPGWFMDSGVLRSLVEAGERQDAGGEQTVAQSIT